MERTRITALVDASPYADDVLRMAQDLSRWTGSPWQVLSQAEVLMPGLLDNAAKASAKADALARVHTQLAEAVRDMDPPPHMQVVDSDVLDAALETTPAPGFFVAGLKGSGILRRIFIGSTVVKLIERSPVPVFAVPRGERLQAPLHLYVGVAPGAPFEGAPLRELVARFGANVGLVTLFSVVAEGEKETQAAHDHLRQVETDLALQVPTMVQLLPGAVGLAGLKEHAATDPHALLVLRRGGRELTDQLFRRYFINELVYDARVPLVVLP